eukprot:gnl/MRDRNA2_/MRDRNA2_136032_c0_seq1.p1 gnl/MRDRNA2_/MRDRNA2_136032_c0~~gnl/MRDRNA2_/MRDRNA2_136032_c0_seq1.p1  ORF type:complete len:596 (+),score=115.92 gnl/MRDRNA2_/MRDRNA2_136032_c0_seq1:83-1870(+)
MLTPTRRLIHAAARKVGCRSNAAVAAVNERLHRRLRLDQVDGLQNVDSAEVALSVLVDAEHFRQGGSQVAATTALSELPQALEDGRQRFSVWEQETQRITEEAQKKQNHDNAKSSNKSQLSSWFGSKKEVQSEARIVGSVCWLSLGRPPVLEPTGCYLYGPVGSGKTTVMDLFCLYGSGQWRVRRQHFHEFTYWAHSSLHELRSRAAGFGDSHCLAVLADRVAEEVDILCFDEFAITNVADAVIFLALLKMLKERRVAVICTTNRPPEDLYKEGLHREAYLPDLVRILRQDFRVVEVNDGCDHREMAAEAANVGTSSEPLMFFCCGTPDAALAKGLLGEPVPVLEQRHVNLPWNRKLDVRSSNDEGLACFHFNELCKRPMSAEDFISVAESFRTVFVHDIPRLAAEDHDQARRFTNLVDVLYERSVLMICHSDVPLTEVLADVESLHEVKSEDMDDESAEAFGVFQRPEYDDSPFSAMKIQEMGGKEAYMEYQKKQMDEEIQRADVVAQRMSSQANTTAVGAHTGSGWSAAPAGADLSAPQQGVAGVMVAAVGSLQETGFAARRAISRLREMQTPAYVNAAVQWRAPGLRGKTSL